MGLDVTEWVCSHCENPLSWMLTFVLNCVCFSIKKVFKILFLVQGSLPTDFSTPFAIFISRLSDSGDSSNCDSILTKLLIVIWLPVEVLLTGIHCWPCDAFSKYYKHFLCAKLCTLSSRGKQDRV